MSTTNASPDRYLVHGPPLTGLSDLLYYDKIVHPTTMAFVRDETTPIGTAIPFQPPLDESVRGALTDAGLLVPPGMLHVQGMNVVDALLAGSQPGGDPVQSLISGMIDSVAGKFAESAFVTLHVPSNPADRDAAFQQFLLDIDKTTKALSTEAQSQGHRAVAKYYRQTATETLGHGAHPVMSVVVGRLPTIDMTTISLDEFIGFVSSDEARRKRRRLFSWQNKLETRVDSGQLRVDDVPDLIATAVDDYTEWLRLQKIGLRWSWAEFVADAGQILIDALSVVKIPDAIRSVVNLKKRSIQLDKEELTAPGRELAYIVELTDRFGT